jgi:hypothetical protein
MTRFVALLLAACSAEPDTLAADAAVDAATDAASNAATKSVFAEPCGTANDCASFDAGNLSFAIYPECNGVCSLVCSSLRAHALCQSLGGECVGKGGAFWCYER